MTDNTAVPFNTSGKPSVSYAQISETDNIVCIKNILLLFLVIKFPKSATESWKKFRIDVRFQERQR
jgi:hypothetical protein